MPSLKVLFWSAGTISRILARARATAACLSSADKSTPGSSLVMRGAFSRRPAVVGVVSTSAAAPAGMSLCNRALSFPASWETIMNM
ncbi:hypothetical protein ACHAPK_011661 [Fusarium culmorum]